MTHCTNKVLAVVVAILALAAAHGAPRSLEGLVDAVLRQGPASRLPAHLSVLLGVSRVEQPTPVKQAVIRDGDTVRIFNVCSANHTDLVLIKYNERSRSSKAYLASPAGKLRRAVAFEGEHAAVERTLPEAARDFATEVKFWTSIGQQRAAPKSTP